MDPKAITDKLPDVWFDWYARLISGCIGLTTYFWFHCICFERKVEEYFLLLFLAYIMGHIIQPFSSKIINWRYRDLQPRTNRLVSKAYAETISMFSCALVTVINIGYGLLSCSDIGQRKYWIAGIFVIVFLFGAHFRAKATADKIKRL